MPIFISSRTGDDVYVKPFITRGGEVLHVKVDVSALTAAEVDAKGYLKPGVPLTIDGLLIGAANAKRVGVVPEAVRIAENNTALASITNDPFVGVEFSGTVNRDLIEDNLGRALTANETAGLNGAGSNIILSLT